MGRLFARCRRYIIDLASLLVLRQRRDSSQLIGISARRKELLLKILPKQLLANKVVESGLALLHIPVGRSSVILAVGAADELAKGHFDSLLQDMMRSLRAKRCAKEIVGLSLEKMM